MYTGKTKNLAVIGDPIAHSLSPVLQNAALQAAGLDYAYIALRVKAEDLQAAVMGLKALDFRGFNVTIPHKHAILPLLDQVDEAAEKIGAVNTVVLEQGKLCGYNTDAYGCMAALRKAGFQPQGKNAVVLGAGGAARAVVWGLLQEKVQKISLGVRNPDKAHRWVDGFGPREKLAVFSWDTAAFSAELAAADLLINTTPLGMVPAVEAMPPVDWQALTPQAFVYDVIYTPKRTRFLLTAERLGHPILNGEGMLIGQGARAFQYWTEACADQQVMQRALHQVLGE